LPGKEKYKMPVRNDLESTKASRTGWPSLKELEIQAGGGAA
jgi:hypothetical protein